jgi:glucose/mannose-6-phosphate isomerase
MAWPNQLFAGRRLFSIFLDLFHKLGITKESYQKDLESAVNYLKAEFNDDTRRRAFEIARKLQNSRIVLLATAPWYVQLLKQTTMFFNEIAMVPTHRNLLHEFSHTEVAAYSAPQEKQSLVVFVDQDDDAYTHQKVATMERLFADKSLYQNHNIEFCRIDIDQDGFFKKFYFTHFFMVQIAYYLGQMANVTGRDLISIAAKNPWWSQESIAAHPSCIDIPGDLSESIKKSIEIV